MSERTNAITDYEKRIAELEAENMRLALKLGAQAEEIMALTERARVFGESNSQLRNALAAQQRWEPVIEDYWGYINVERNGRAITVHVDDNVERDKDYIVAPLPDGLYLCRRQGGNDAQ